MPKHYIATDELHAIAHCCMIAGERFKAHAAMLREAEKEEGHGMMTPAAAARLAEQFEFQAKQAAELEEIFREGSPFAIEISDELAEELEGAAA